MIVLDFCFNLIPDTSYNGYDHDKYVVSLLPIYTLYTLGVCIMQPPSTAVGVGNYPDCCQLTGYIINLHALYPLPY